ncbi:MAG: PEP-CTERM sorting domain-containing protein [Opitutales bacterium]|nr:PEP-CTERM sorting domain-containing protein [Opitutales bacterium]
MKKSFLIASILALPSVTLAQSNFVTGGFTSVSLNGALLESAANLQVAGADGTVPPAPGFGGAGFVTVAFPITAPTTFSYTDGLATFAGVITHTGTVTFNLGPDFDSAVSFGDFTIGFDSDRVGGSTSGFFVQNTLVGDFDGVILFDLTAPTSAVADSSELALGGFELLVSPELGNFLFTSGLAAADLTGAAVGLAQLDATAIPEPSTYAAIAAIAVLGLALRRRLRR